MNPTPPWRGRLSKTVMIDYASTFKCYQSFIIIIFVIKLTVKGECHESK